MNRILRFDIFESLKNKRYNNILKNLGVMSEEGNVKLDDMKEKIENFLSVNGNKEKFLKDYNSLKPKVEIENFTIKVNDLKPSQSEIFLDHILSRMVVKDDDREDILDGKLRDRDILISSDKHIIDGHHRWATAFILNPNCEIECTLIEIPIISALPIINAMIESEDISSDKVIKYDINLFESVSWGKKKLKKEMKSIIEKTIKNGIDLGEKENKKSEIIKTKKDLYDILNKENPLKYLRKNMKKINKPENIFPDREDMPQLKAKDAKEIL